MMSNKLKTLPPSLIEQFLKEKVDHYLDEDCTCTVSNMDTPNIDTEADPAHTDKRDLTFNVKLSYQETSGA